MMEILWRKLTDAVYYEYKQYFKVLYEFTHSMRSAIALVQHKNFSENEDI